MKTKTSILLAALSCLASSAFSGVLKGPITNPTNGHIYYLLAPASWTDAEAEAIQLGGHLATINDAAENTWVLDTFATTNADVWIGFTWSPQGTFGWINGEPATYTHWRTGEPNNILGDEYYTLLYSVLTVDRPPPGSWNDAPNTYILNAVVEAVPSNVPCTYTSLASIGTWSPTNNVPVNGISASGTHTIARLGDSEVGLLDISNPAAPTVLGSWTTFLPLSDAVQVGSLAYLGSWETDLLSTVEIVDFTDPAKPALKGYYDTAGYVQQLVLRGRVAYVADAEGGLAILDVGDPAWPRLLGGYDTKGSVQHVEVYRNYAYISDGNWLVTLDVSDPANPRRVGLNEVAGGISSLKADGTKLYLSAGTGDFRVLDVSDPASIQLLGTYRSVGSPARAMAVSGQYLYMARETAGLHVLDVSDPAKPAYVTGTWVSPAEDVALMGKYALVAGGYKGLLVCELQKHLYPPLMVPVMSGGMMTFTWAATNDISLQTTTNLVDPVWQDVPDSEGTNSISLSLTDGNAFFRLAKTQKLSDRFVWIPAGTFVMGSPPNEQDRWYWEGPQATVTISRGFWMGKYEVTQGEYLAVTGTNPSLFAGDLNRPVETVKWADAVEYCERLTQRDRLSGRLSGNAAYRLPTEAEWEYACRAGTGGRYSFGDDPGYQLYRDYAWYRENSDWTTHPVGQKLPNPWGLYDMSGNVWEWCLDWFGPYPGGTVVDPTGPVSGSYRVIRGSDYYGAASDGRSAYRDEDSSPVNRDGRFGFRIILAPSQP